MTRQPADSQATSSVAIVVTCRPAGRSGRVAYSAAIAIVTIAAAIDRPATTSQASSPIAPGSAPRDRAIGMPAATSDAKTSEAQARPGTRCRARSPRHSAPVATSGGTRSNGRLRRAEDHECNRRARRRPPAPIAAATKRIGSRRLAAAEPSAVCSRGRPSRRRPTAPGSRLRPSQPSRTASSASSVRLRTPYRPNNRRRWLSTVLMLIPSPTAISSFVAPRASSRSASSSRALGWRGASRSALSVTAGKLVSPRATASTASRMSLDSLAFDEVAGRARFERRAKEARLLEAAQHQHPGSAAAAERLTASRPPGWPPIQTSHTTTSGGVRSTSSIAASTSVALPTISIPGRESAAVDERGKDRRVIVDEREADHRPSVAGGPAAAKPMDTLNPGGRRSGLGGDSLQIDRPDATGSAGLGSHERRGDDPARERLDDSGFAVVQARTDDPDAIADREISAGGGPHVDRYDGRSDVDGLRRVSGRRRLLVARRRDR